MSQHRAQLLDDQQTWRICLDCVVDRQVASWGGHRLGRLRTCAAIPDFNAEPPAVAAAAQKYAAFMGVLQRIGQQDTQHLLKQARVTFYDELTGYYLEFQTFSAGFVAELIGEPIQQIADAKV